MRGEGGGGRGSQADVGPHRCEAYRRDLGDTRALFLHLQTGGGRCLFARGQTFSQFKEEFRRRQKHLYYLRSNARQKVSPGLGFIC